MRYLTDTELEAAPGNALFLLMCRGYQDQWWNDGGGYGINPNDAKIWTKSEAIAQLRQKHERREAPVSVFDVIDGHRGLTERVIKTMTQREQHRAHHELYLDSSRVEAILEGRKRALCMTTILQSINDGDYLTLVDKHAARCLRAIVTHTDVCGNLTIISIFNLGLMKPVAEVQ